MCVRTHATHTLNETKSMGFFQNTESFLLEWYQFDVIPLQPGISMVFSKSNVNPKLTPLLSSREGEQSIWAPVKNVVAFLCNIVAGGAAKSIQSINVAAVVAVAGLASPAATHYMKKLRQWRKTALFLSLFQFFFGAAIFFSPCPCPS